MPPNYTGPEYWDWTFAFLVGNDYFAPRAYIWVVHIDARLMALGFFILIGLLGFWLYTYRKRIFA